MTIPKEERAELLAELQRCHPDLELRNVKVRDYEALLDALDEAERERDEWVLTCDGLKAEQKKAERRIAELEAENKRCREVMAIHKLSLGEWDNGQFGVGA